jgi:hypothetical protein
MSGRLTLKEQSKICIAGASSCTSATSSNYKNAPIAPTAPAPPAAAFRILSGSSSTVLDDDGKYAVFHGIFHAPNGNCDLQDGEGLRWYGALTCDRLEIDQYNHFWIDDAIAEGVAASDRTGTWSER